MKLVPALPACPSRNYLMLDDAEMALQMHDLAPEATQLAAAEARRPVRAARPTPAPMRFDDFLTELYAAAGMIMSRAECEALAMEMLERHELVLAA